MSDIERDVLEGAWRAGAQATNAAYVDEWGYENLEAAIQYAIRALSLEGAVANPLDDPGAMARATEALQVSANMPHDERAAYVIAAALGGQ